LGGASLKKAVCNQADWEWINGGNLFAQSKLIFCFSEFYFSFVRKIG
jgi:hypothetical protein